jgi:alanine racemase
MIGIGQGISQHRRVFEDAGLDCSFHSGTTSFLEQFHPSQFRDESILLKGARVFEFERISKSLEQKIHQTVLEINLSAIAHNLKQYQQLLKPETKLMVMVKAFSYGSGTYEIANLLQFHKVDYLAVAYADEGVELRKSGISLPIMVMNAEENSFGPLTEYSLQPEMYSFGILSEFDAFLKSEGITDFPVHIKMDTGMHRLGFETKETAALGRFLTGTASFRVQTVFTHLASGEDPLEDDYTKQQADVFTASCIALEKQLGYKFIRHAANTAAIVRHPALHLDMVRLGIGLYGIDSAASGKLDLKQASILKTTVAQIKKVKAGDTVGYNRRGKVERDSVIATITLGYADGYPRRLSNGRGKVIIHGKAAPVIGNICMDMTMVDISNVPGVKTGDEVIVFGNELPLTQLAQWAETIPYEIMTGVSQRVKRVYFEE